MIRHYAETGDASVLCGAMRIWDARHAGELADDPTDTTCAECRAVLIADGDLPDSPRYDSPLLREGVSL